MSDHELEYLAARLELNRAIRNRAKPDLRPSEAVALVDVLSGFKIDWDRMQRAHAAAYARGYTTIEEAIAAAPMLLVTPPSPTKDA